MGYDPGCLQFVLVSLLITSEELETRALGDYLDNKRIGDYCHE